MTLTDFLLARIAEDEDSARLASPGPWHLNSEDDEVIAVDDITVAEAFALSGNQQRNTARHIARHDPARILAECEAKRRIVENFEAAASVGSDDAECMAAAYQHHADYRVEWHP